MKLSLAWIFDHIDADWRHQNIDEIVTRFNAVTAEIESVQAHCVDLTPYSMVRVESCDDVCSVLVFDHNELRDMPGRPDMQQGLYYMVKQVQDHYDWANLADFDVEKKGLLPAFDITEKQAQGSWKELFEHDDILLEVDNKSITHRPDMWGHRGFAREIAAFMKLPFKDAAYFLKEQDVLYAEQKSSPTDATPYGIDNQATDKCSRFCGLYYPVCKNRPSSIKMASRLLKVGARPINALVDITNYLMFDWSQPVHVYDAEKITDRKIIIRTATHGERLMLLGEEEINLTTEDLVIADTQKSLGLAGAKGGMYDSLTDTTKSIFFEAATFDAASVRRSALRHKMRTDASARFEKTLNEDQALEAVFRFKALLEEYNIEATASEKIVVVGKEKKPVKLEVLHSFLEKRSGIKLNQTDIVDPLTRLGFIISVKKHDNDIEYVITIPPFRASKDIAIKEDILEEVIRCYGYKRIPLVLPAMSKEPFDMTSIMRLRKIKQFFSQVLRMTEQQNYSLYDEAFLASLELSLDSSAHIINPVSKNMSRMVSSLVPGLLKNIRDNQVHKDSLSFFECGRVWRGNSDNIIELKSVAGIILQKHKLLDFYEIKQRIIDLFALLQLPNDEILWQKIEHEDCPSWLLPFQTTSIQYGDHSIGVLGRLNTVLLDKLGLSDADAMIFEIDNDFLLSHKKITHRMQPISKFQDTYFDISLLVPLHIQTASLFELFKQVDPLITKTELIDFFEQESWHDVRSLTFRFWLSHLDKTLEKPEIDAVRERVLTIASAYGTKLRV